MNATQQLMLITFSVAFAAGIGLWWGILAAIRFDKMMNTGLDWLFSNIKKGWQS